MGIFKHPKTGIYHANYFNDSGKRCRPSLHTRDKRIAQIKFAEIVQSKEALSGNASKIPWQAFKNKFIETITPERTKTTINHFKRACFYLESELHPKYLTDITPLKLQELKTILKEQGKGEAGINRWLRALKTMLRKAEDWNYIAPQKWQTVGSFKEVEHRIVFFTVAELKKMLKHANTFQQ
ncbi:phage integrase SAM-like domain-containing protein, partial [Candidatus Proelusimicrobium excrementi]|uniref:phage integrase SAM-like domain-containing protein n=1 Tax=Candidatus Proelusimicrobium excrementi TaxID=3416222 RepID=UPI003D0BE52D